jgi:3-(3-hydroxy-phenyl)propionate hydroxylase
MIEFSIFNKSLVSVNHPARSKARDAALLAAVRTPGLSDYVRNMGMKPKPKCRKGSTWASRVASAASRRPSRPQVTARTYDGAGPPR